MAKLVAQERPHLVVIEQLQRAGVDDDERPVHPVGARVDERRLGYEQLGPRVPIHRRQHVGIQLVETRELPRPDAHGVCLEQQANAALADESVDLLHHLVEPGNGAQ